MTEKKTLGTSLVVQWLRLLAPNAGGMGPIPGQGTKIPHATWHDQKKKKRKEDSALSHLDRFYQVWFITPTESFASLRVNSVKI